MESFYLYIMIQNPLITYIESYIELSDHEEQLITEAYQPLHLEKREVLYEQGKVCTIEAYVLQGTLRVYNIDEKGMEHVLNFALPGWWVGDLGSFYQGTPAFTNVQALEDSELLVIHPEEKEALFRQIPALERMFREVIQKHLISFQKRFLCTVSATAEERYKHLMEQVPNLEQLVPQHQIASYLGILPESLSRLKKQMIESEK